MCRECSLRGRVVIERAKHSLLGQTFTNWVAVITLEIQSTVFGTCVAVFGSIKTRNQE